MAASNTPPAGGSGDGHGDMTPEEREAFKKRADELGKRLETAKNQASSVPKPGAVASENAANNDALGKAMRISTELIGGVVVGCGLGWLIDRALGTWPAFFIVCFLLGSAAGMINVVRAGTAMKTGASNPKAGPSVRDDDDET
jgi:ATP synthase protein I